MMRANVNFKKVRFLTRAPLASVSFVRNHAGSSGTEPRASVYKRIQKYSGRRAILGFLGR
jgi:hypothetical protein